VVIIRAGPVFIEYLDFSRKIREPSLTGTVRVPSGYIPNGKKIQRRMEPRHVG
jgi:hypothetical protein